MNLMFWRRKRPTPLQRATALVNDHRVQATVASIATALLARKAPTPKSEPDEG